jgi:SAM-dependent methyltransferase
VLLRHGSAAEIPLDDGTVDVTVSGLVLNFVPNGRAAVSEMARVTAPGGTIAAYVWDYAGKMELMRYLWDAALELNPEAAKLDEGLRFPLCRPEALTELFATPGCTAPERGQLTSPRALPISKITGGRFSAVRDRRRRMLRRSMRRRGRA